MKYFIYAKYIEGPNKKKYYFTGGAFDTTVKNRLLFDTLKEANKIFYRKMRGKMPPGIGVYHDKISAPRKAAKKKATKKRAKNPTSLDTNRKIEKAIKNFEEFTGHTPEYIDNKSLPKMDVGFKVGTCDGILYTTVRDGITEKYIHKFKKRARPILASNFDGSFIALLDGNYSFTDRGIVDN